MGLRERPELHPARQHRRGRRGSLRLRSAVEPSPTGNGLARQLHGNHVRRGRLPVNRGRRSSQHQHRRVGVQGARGRIARQRKPNVVRRSGRPEFDLGKGDVRLSGQRALPAQLRRSTDLRALLRGSLQPSWNLHLPGRQRRARGLLPHRPVGGHPGDRHLPAQPSVQYPLVHGSASRSHRSQLQRVR